MGEPGARRIGPYALHDVIGDGGMGTVYAALDSRFARKVAVKLLHPHLARNPEVVRRFRTEAVIGAKLSHPNIVRVYDVVEGEGVVGFVMEHVEGMSLDRLLGELRGGLPPPEACRLFRQVVSGVAHAHAAGLVHRDIKPSNVLVEKVDGEWHAKVTDFGVAKVMGGETHLTGMGAKIGTLAYMSPEQIEDPASVDARSDVYSLGVLAYEMLTGRVPFDTGTEFEVMRRILAGEFRPIEVARSSLPGDLAAIVRTCLATNAFHRFEDGRALLAAMGAGRAASVRPPPPPTRTTRAPAADPREPASTSHDAPSVEVDVGPHPSRRGRGVVVGAAVAAFVVGAVVVSAVLASKRSEGGQRGATGLGSANGVPEVRAGASAVSQDQHRQPVQQPPSAPGRIQGRVLQRLDAPPYSYLRIATADGEVWAAAPATDVANGSEVAIESPMPMSGFESKTLARRFDLVYFGSLTLLTAPPANDPPSPGAAAADASSPAGRVSPREAPDGRDVDAAEQTSEASETGPTEGPSASAEPLASGDDRVGKAASVNARTVAETHARREALRDKTVAIRAKVVKRVEGVMGRNWLHLRDGTGTPDARDNDLPVTTTNEAGQVGEIVTAIGTVRVGRDYGASYTYPVIVEDATIVVGDPGVEGSDLP